MNDQVSAEEWNLLFDNSNDDDEFNKFVLPILFYCCLCILLVNTCFYLPSLFDSSCELTRGDIVL